MNTPYALAVHGEGSAQLLQLCSGRQPGPMVWVAGVPVLQWHPQPASRLLAGLLCNRLLHLSCVRAVKALQLLLVALLHSSRAATALTCCPLLLG